MSGAIFCDHATLRPGLFLYFPGELRIHCKSHLNILLNRIRYSAKLAPDRCRHHEGPRQFASSDARTTYAASRCIGFPCSTYPRSVAPWHHHAPLGESHARRPSAELARPTSVRIADHSPEAREPYSKRYTAVVSVSAGADESSTNRGQSHNNPQRYAQLVQLEVRPEIRYGKIHARSFWKFGHLYARFP